jgi:hypothetical protein
MVVCDRFGSELMSPSPWSYELAEVGLGSATCPVSGRNAGGVFRVPPLPVPGC